MGYTTRITENFHHVPAQSWTRSAYTVLRAGRVETACNYRIERPEYPGQDLLYCLSGGGAVESLGRRVGVYANQLVWIANEKPHVHEPEPDEPWVLLWCRIDGPDTAAIRERLFGSRPPVVTFPEAAAPLSWFDRLFQAFRNGDHQSEVLLNLLVAELLMLIERCGSSHEATALPEPLRKASEAMRARPELPWHADDLSSLIGVSPSQVRRLFRRYLGASPHQWLVRERLVLAQALLVDTEEPISEIAERCGFCDVYHFGREFKRVVGISPAAWRDSEIG